MQRKVILLINVVLLLLSVVWLIAKPDFEPAIATCSALGVLVAASGPNTSARSNGKLILLISIAVVVVAACLGFSFMRGNVIGIKGDGNTHNKIIINK